MPSLLDALPSRVPATSRGEAALLSLGLLDPEQDRLKVLLASAADPDAAIHYLVSLRQQQTDAFARLLQAPSALKYLITAASFSRFLSEEILQHPEC
jgi:hypothetical protein